MRIMRLCVNAAFIPTQSAFVLIQCLASVWGSAHTVVDTGMVGERQVAVGPRHRK
jgi:hypothetical protein